MGHILVEISRPPGSVLSAKQHIQPNETLEAAALRMKKHDVGSLVVCEDESVVGIITDRDILMRTTSPTNKLSQATVRRAMSAEARCCFEDDDVNEAAALMDHLEVRRLPVLSRDHKLVGLVSQTDLRGGASKGAGFEVVFFKELCSSNGQPHRAEQARIFVGSDVREEEAPATAIAQLEQECRSAWTTVADGYEVIRESGPRDDPAREDSRSQ